MFDIAVIGRGLIGSAAARHIAENGQRVVVIGPDEPTDRRLSSGPFCSHPKAELLASVAERRFGLTLQHAPSKDTQILLHVLA